MGGRPRKMDRATLTMAMAAMSDPKANAADVARRLGMTTTTLYTYLNGDGSPKAAGSARAGHLRHRLPAPALRAGGGRVGGVHAGGG